MNFPTKKIFFALQVVNILKVEK